MSFLDWVADWAEEHIPLVGSHIANLVRNIQYATEAWLSWVIAWVKWLRDSFWPWTRDWINWLCNAYNSLRYYVYNYLVGSVNWIKDRLLTLWSDFYNWAIPKINWLVNGFNNLSNYVYNWLTDWLRDLQNAFNSFRSWVLDNINSIWNWINNAPNWFWYQLNNAKNAILSWVYPLIKPLSDWISWFQREFYEFLKDPIGYIRKAVNPLIKQIYDFFKPITDNISRSLENAWKTIMSLDQAIRYGFTSFLMGMLAWFFTSFFRDLVELEYDPETGEVYGTPENPFTYVVIELMKVEKPKPPLE